MQHRKQRITTFKLVTWYRIKNKITIHLHSNKYEKQKCAEIRVVYYSYSLAKNIQLRLSVQCLADFHKEFRRKKNLNAFFIPSQYRLKIFSRNLFEVLTTILRHWKVMRHNFESQTFFNNWAWEEWLRRSPVNSLQNSSKFIWK